MKFPIVSSLNRIRIAIVIGFVGVSRIVIIISLFNVIIRIVIMVWIVLNYVRIRLRLECLGSLISLDGPTFHATPINLRIVFQCKIYTVYLVSCFVEINFYNFNNHSPPQ